MQKVEYLVKLRKIDQERNTYAEDSLDQHSTLNNIGQGLIGNRTTGAANICNILLSEEDNTLLNFNKENYLRYDHDKREKAIVCQSASIERAKQQLVSLKSMHTKRIEPALDLSGYVSSERRQAFELGHWYCCFQRIQVNPSVVCCTCRMAETTCVKRLQKEFRALCKEPAPNVPTRPSPSDILEWNYVLEGSEGTPFLGGVYHGSFQSGERQAEGTIREDNMYADRIWLAMVKAVSTMRRFSPRFGFIHLTPPDKLPDSNWLPARHLDHLSYLFRKVLSLTIGVCNGICDGNSFAPYSLHEAKISAVLQTRSLIPHGFRWPSLHRKEWGFLILHRIWGF